MIPRAFCAREIPGTGSSIDGRCQDIWTPGSITGAPHSPVVPSISGYPRSNARIGMISRQAAPRPGHKSATAKSRRWAASQREALSADLLDRLAQRGRARIGEICALFLSRQRGKKLRTAAERCGIAADGVARECLQCFRRDAIDRVFENFALRADQLARRL